MPRGNGITLWIIASWLLASLLSSSAKPLVIGYERFYADKPSAEGGRLLFNELGCANCHEVDTGLPAYPGPKLEGLQLRLNADWIRQFLEAPQATKPGSTMPDLQLRKQEIEAILHYLASLKTKKVPKAFKFVNSERGMALYHQIGCVACHDPGPDFLSPAGKPDFNDFSYPAISLDKLEDKYDISSLSDFLYNSHTQRPAGRMPQFTLDREDGGDIAAYLLNYQNGDSEEYPRREPFEPDPSLANIGRMVVESKNCQACHQLTDTELASNPRLPISKEFQDLTQLSGHPQYDLDENQQTSIAAYLRQQDASGPAVTHQLEALNCYACHEQDGRGGADEARQVYFTGDAELGLAGRLPPPLNQLTAKLKKEWFKGALEGDKKVRPYLHTQMPNFGESIHPLIELIPEDKEQSEVSPGREMEWLASGQKLLGTTGGLGCITCHDWGEHKSLGIQALDISISTDRLRPDWFKQYLIDPSKTHKDTLMPSFWPQGQASNRDILNGDTHKQISAIYDFIASGSGIPKGFPSTLTGAYEMIPAGKPVVQRMFVDEVGTHVLVVGYPEGIHLAFNTESGQPALMWKGRFIDGYSTWYSRFPEFEKPLGQELVSWAKPRKSPQASFKGYRLDSEGRPEFILQYKDAEILEQFIPQKEGQEATGMLRVISYSGLGQLNDERLTHPSDVSKTELKDNDPMVRTFLYQW